MFQEKKNLKFVSSKIFLRECVSDVHRLTNTNKTHNKYKAQNQIQIQSPKPGNNFILPLNLDVDAPAQHRHAHLERGHVDHWWQKVFKLSLQRLSHSWRGSKKYWILLLTSFSGLLPSPPASSSEPPGPDHQRQEVLGPLIWGAAPVGSQGDCLSPKAPRVQGREWDCQSTASTCAEHQEKKTQWWATPKHWSEGPWGGGGGAVSDRGWGRSDFSKIIVLKIIFSLQGQTLKQVGVWLVSSPCFSHGQLYVAASRFLFCLILQINFV